MKMHEMPYAHGVLLGTDEGVLHMRTNYPDLYAHIQHWRLTTAGDIIAVFDQPILAYGIRWEWPMIPVCCNHGYNVVRVGKHSVMPVKLWCTASMYELLAYQYDSEIPSSILNLVHGRFNPDSHKVNHQFIYADRKKGIYVATPMLKREFNCLEDALEMSSMLKTHTFDKKMT